MFFQICNLWLFIVKCSYRQKEERQKKAGFPLELPEVGGRLAE